MTVLNPADGAPLESPEIVPQAVDQSSRLALVLTGGGARAAYQVGFLRCLARHAPETRIPIVTGVSAGAINAAELASHPGTLTEAVDELSELWSGLTPDRIFKVGAPSLVKSFLRWGLRLVSGGAAAAPRAKAILDSSPLGVLLHRALGSTDGSIPGIGANLASGRLRAFALTTLNYNTAQTVTWVQGRDIDGWQRPSRVGVEAEIRVEHILASSALPLLFPAVRLGPHWFGDGGIRLSAPLAPAIHLGADRILAICTRYKQSRAEANEPTVVGYPPPAQVAGIMLNSVFLDNVDQDAARLRRVNRLLEQIAPEHRGHLKPIRLTILRPSQDLGRLAGQFEPDLPPAFRFATRGLGTRETSSPDFLSLLMFQPDYLKRLIEIGEADAEAKIDEIRRLVEA